MKTKIFSRAQAGWSATLKWCGGHYSFVNFTAVCSQVRCAMCVDPGLLPMETDMAKHRREVLTQLMRNGRVIEL